MISEEKEVFYADVLEKKSIGMSYHHKKNGSLTAKLPFNVYSEKQSNKKDGEVVKYNLKAPMNWETFKSMPLDLQKEYYQICLNNGGTNDSIGNMMGVSKKTISNWLRASNYPSPNTRGRGRRLDVLAWNAFLKGPSITDIIEKSPEEKLDALVAAGITDPEIIAKEIDIPQAPQSPSEPPEIPMPKGIAVTGEVSFTCTWYEAYQMLEGMLGSSVRKFTIRFEEDMHED